MLAVANEAQVERKTSGERSEHKFEGWLPRKRTFQLFLQLNTMRCHAHEGMRGVCLLEPDPNPDLAHAVSGVLRGQHLQEPAEGRIRKVHVRRLEVRMIGEVREGAFHPNPA